MPDNVVEEEGGPVAFTMPHIFILLGVSNLLSLNRAGD